MKNFWPKNQTKNTISCLKVRLHEQLPWAEEIAFERDEKDMSPQNMLWRVVVHTTVGEKVIRLRTQYYASYSIIEATNNGVLAGILERNFDAWFWSPDREDVFPEDVE